MNLLQDDRATRLIAIIEANLEECPALSLPPEGNVKLNYRLLNENLRNPSEPKTKLVPRFDVSAISPPRSKILELLRPEDPGRDALEAIVRPVPRFDVSTISSPRSKILELLRPEDPGRDALEAIVRPVPRRGLSRPLDEDTRRFLQRALQSPSYITLVSEPKTKSEKSESIESALKSTNSIAERSLADELREAEEDELTGGRVRRELLREFRRRSAEQREAMERDRLGKLALSVEEDEVEDSGFCDAARKIDALLAESRKLHEELAGIQEDLQAQSARAFRCTAAARALSAESLTLRYLDDVVALLRGDITAASRVKAWPFANGRRQPGRNYVI